MKYEMMTEDQRDLVDLVHRVLSKELDPKLPELDEKGEYPMEVHNALGKAGFWAMDVPEEYGGVGFDTVTTCLVREALGYHDGGFASSFSASTFGIKPVLLFGTEEQKKEYGDRLARGQISAQLITEPQSGSDMGRMLCKAVRDGDDYIINGTKCFITNGGLADIYTLAASTDPSKGKNGISLFIVDRNTAGVSVGKEENKLGIRVSNTTDVAFSDVRIPAKNLIGEEGKAFGYLGTLLARTRPTGMAPALGVAQKALDLSIEYSRIRETFGQKIGRRQAIQFKIADMECRLQAARAQLLYNAQVIDEGNYDTTLGSITKIVVSEACMEVCHEAIQIYGGYGYSREYPLEKLFRDARIYSIFEGTNEIQRQIIGRSLIGQVN